MKKNCLLLLILLLSLVSHEPGYSRHPQEITPLDTDDRLNILFHRYPASWIRQSFSPEITLKYKMLLLNIASVNARFFGIDRSYVLPFTSDDSPWFYTILIKENSGLVSSETSNIYEIGYSVTDGARVSLISELTSDKSFIDLGVRARAGIGSHAIMATYRQIDYLFNEKHPSEGYYDIFPERIDVSWLFDRYPHTLFVQASEGNMSRFIETEAGEPPNVTQRDEDAYRFFYRLSMTGGTIGADTTYQRYLEEKGPAQGSAEEQVSIATFEPFLNLSLSRSLLLHTTVDITHILFTTETGEDSSYAYTGGLSLINQELLPGVFLQYGYAIMSGHRQGETEEKIIINLEFSSPGLGTLRLINSWNPEPAADGLFLWNGSGGQYIVFF